MTDIEMFWRLLLSFICGTIVGLERQWTPQERWAEDQHLGRRGRNHVYHRCRTWIRRSVPAASRRRRGHRHRVYRGVASS